MPALQSNQAPPQEPATFEDVETILGRLDPNLMLAILTLRPTVADVEHAKMWLAGDLDVFGAEPPLKGVPSQIVTILTADEEEERREAG